MTRIDAALVAFAVITLLWPSAAGTEWAIGALALAGTLCAFCYAWRGRWQILAFAAVFVLIAIGRVFAGSVPAGLIEVPLLIAIAAVVAFLYLSPVPKLPRPTGEYGVGFRCFDDPDGRQWQAHIWYPAVRTADGARRRYHTRAEAFAIAKGLRKLGSSPFAQWHLQLTRTQARIDAPEAEGSFPLVVFNHGGLLYPMQNTALAQELASQGFVVAAIGHPDESLGLAWSDGTVAPLALETLAQMQGSEGFQSLVQAWMAATDAADKDIAREKLAQFGPNGLCSIAAAWARLSIAAADAIIASPMLRPGTIDATRLAYAGMSLGGATSMICCRDDPRARAGINLDGVQWCFGAFGEGLSVPILQIYQNPGQLPDQNSAFLGYNDWILGKSTAGVVRIVMAGLGHMAFTDRIFGASPLARRSPDIGPSASAQTGQRINALCHHFLEQALAATSPPSRQQSFSALQRRFS